jgi:hypothetical protein
MIGGIIYWLSPARRKRKIKGKLKELWLALTIALLLDLSDRIGGKPETGVVKGLSGINLLVCQENPTLAGFV